MLPTPRGEARVLQPDADGHRTVGVVGAVDERIGIVVAEAVHAVEDVRRAPVPELAVVEDGVDHGGRVPPHHLADVHARHPESRLVGQRRQRLARLARPAAEPESRHALRADDVVRRRREREVVGREGAVRPQARREGRVGVSFSVGADPSDARVELVLRPAVGAGVEVAGGARRPPVAPHLHVPEERLPEDDERRAVADERVQAGGARHRDRLQRRRARRIVHRARAVGDQDGRRQNGGGYDAGTQSLVFLWTAQSAVLLVITGSSFFQSAALQRFAPAFFLASKPTTEKWMRP
jgi:hypothetical protein